MINGSLTHPTLRAGFDGRGLAAKGSRVPVDLHAEARYDSDGTTIRGRAEAKSQSGKQVPARDEKRVNRFVAHENADQYRPDVHESRRAADDWHGFLFKTPKLSRGAHEARVAHAVCGVLHAASLAHRTSPS